MSAGDGAATTQTLDDRADLTKGPTAAEGAPTQAEAGGGSGAGEHPDAARARRRGAPRWLLWLLTALCVLLVIAVALLAVQVRSQSKADDGRVGALDAARQTAVISTTVSVASFDSYRSKMLAHTTGEFKDTFTSTLEAYKKELIDSKIDVTSEVKSAGLVRSDATTATALVALHAVKKNIQAPEGVESDYRMKLELQKVSGDWLVSSLQFVA